MRNLLTRLFAAPHPAPRRRPRPALEWLEEREVPAVTIQIDYSYDTSGFFNDPARRAVLEQAANDLAARLDTSLAAVAPGGGNTWAETVFDPSTGRQVTVDNPSVGAGTIVVYAGARDLPGTEAGVGGYGGYSASGSQAWLNAVSARGPGFTLWGGALSFDTNGTNWYFGSSAAGIGADQVDFYSVAVHELGHLLGIGTAPTWFSQVSGGRFTGANAEAVYGGPVPLDGSSDHWADGVADYAFGTGAGTAAAVRIIDGASGADLVGTTAVLDGFTGGVFLAAGDVDRDGAAELAMSADTEGGTRVVLFRVADGRLDPRADFLAFGDAEFRGGARVAMGDVNRDGAVDLIVGAGPGGGPRVAVYDGASLLTGHRFSRGSLSS